MRDRKSDKHPGSVAFLLSQVGARAAQEFGKSLAPLNFTPPDVGILRLLSQSPGISQQDLARRLDMHASRLVALIDSLEERKLVTRNPNAGDRRLYSLELTDVGREALGAIGRVARAHDNAICAVLDDAERAQLADLLQKIAARLGLTPGVHPGYRGLRAQEEESSGRQANAGSKREFSD